jgi:cytochrome c oxidase assembly protein subunit 15
MGAPESSVPGSDAAVRLRILFRRMAFVAAALTFIVISASAFMRHTQAGLSCDDWPACYGRVAAPGVSAADASRPAADVGAGAVPSQGVRLARLAHRIAATGVLALVIGLLLIAWTQEPAWKREGRAAAAALVTAGALAALGIATPGAQFPAVTLGNLLGGYLMLALLAATWASAGDAPSRGPRRWLPFVTLVLLFAQAALGGTIGAQYALTACPTLGGCVDLAVDATASGSAFDPFRALAASGGRVLPPADAGNVHVVHRWLGVVATLLTLVVALAVRRSNGRVAGIIAATAILTPILGALAIVALPSLLLTVLHNAMTALTIAALAALLARG